MPALQPGRMSGIITKKSIRYYRGSVGGERLLRFFNETMETMPRPEMEKLQLLRLRGMVDYVMERVPFYRERLTSAGIRSGSDIRSIQEIERIPFTTKEDLRDAYPDGCLAVPRSLHRGNRPFPIPHYR